MALIALNGMEFFAYHGFYDEERKIGNRFGVDLQVETAMAEDINDDLNQTVNYEELYQMVRREILIPSNLLEDVASRIAEEAMLVSTQIKVVKVKVIKFNPPVGGICREASVEVQRQRA